MFNKLQANQIKGLYTSHYLYIRLLQKILLHRVQKMDLLRKTGFPEENNNNKIFSATRLISFPPINIMLGSLPIVKDYLARFIRC